jgi:hypothetical protein
LGSANATNAGSFNAEGPTDAPLARLSKLAPKMKKLGDVEHAAELPYYRH